MVAEETAGRQIPMAFLEHIKDDFTEKYGSGEAATVSANGLNKEYGYMQIYSKTNPVVHEIYFLLKWFSADQS